MRHIRQINSVGTNSYTVVVAEEPLESHRSIINHSDLFEISEDELPEFVSLHWALTDQPHDNPAEVFFATVHLQLFAASAGPASH